MKRSSYITWDQLKVGVLILVALLILAVAIVKLGQAGNLFGKRYHLVSFVSNASGLRVGGPVTVAGQLAGSVEDVKFLPPNTDTARKLILVVEVDRNMQEQVRKDSRAKIKTQACSVTRCSTSRLGRRGFQHCAMVTRLSLPRPPTTTR